MTRYLAVFAVAAYVEPEVTRQGEQALHEMPLDFDGMLRSVRFDPTEPVRLVAGLDQLPQRSGVRF